MGKTVQEQAWGGERWIKSRRVDLEPLNEQHMQGTDPCGVLGWGCLKDVLGAVIHLQSITEAEDWMIGKGGKHKQKWRGSRTESRGRFKNWLCKPPTSSDFKKNAILLKLTLWVLRSPTMESLKHRKPWVRSHQCFTPLQSVRQPATVPNTQQVLEHMWHERSSGALGKTQLRRQHQRLWCTFRVCHWFFPPCS